MAKKAAPAKKTAPRRSRPRRRRRLRAPDTTASRRRPAPAKKAPAKKAGARRRPRRPRRRLPRRPRRRRRRRRRRRPPGQEGRRLPRRRQPAKQAARDAARRAARPGRPCRAELRSWTAGARRVRRAAGSQDELAEMRADLTTRSLSWTSTSTARELMRRLRRRGRRRPGRRRQQDLRARAGAVDRGQPAGPADPDPARGRAHRRGHLRLLRELRQADPEGPAARRSRWPRSTSRASSARNGADRASAGRDNGRRDCPVTAADRRRPAPIGGDAAPAASRRVGAVRRRRGRSCSPSTSSRKVLVVANLRSRTRPVRLLGGAVYLVADPQLRRGVLPGHRRHGDPHRRRARRRSWSSCARPAACARRAGRSRSAWSSAARWATSPTGSSATPGRRPGPRGRLDQPVRPRRRTSGRSSTSPTRRSCAARSWPRVTGRCAASTSTAADRRRAVTWLSPPAARPGRAGRAAAGRRAVPAVRLLADRGRRADRRRRRARRRRPARAQVANGARRRLLEVQLPRRRRRRDAAPSRSTGMAVALRRRRHRGRRQAGRRRRPPQPGLDRPDGHRRAGRDGLPDRRPAARPSGRASCTGSTSARPGVMVVAKSERAYSRAQAGVQGARRSTSATPRWSQGHPDPDPRHHRRADRPAPAAATTSSPWSPAAGRASPTTTPSRRSGRRRCSTSSSRPAAPTRSGCTWPRVRHPCVGDLTYGADPVLAARLGLTRQWLHARELGFEHPTTGRVAGHRVAVPRRPAARARRAAR